MYDDNGWKKAFAMLAESSCTRGGSGSGDNENATVRKIMRLGEFFIKIYIIYISYMLDWNKSLEGANSRSFKHLQMISTQQ